MEREDPGLPKTREPFFWEATATAKNCPRLVVDALEILPHVYSLFTGLDHRGVLGEK